MAIRVVRLGSPQDSIASHDEALRLMGGQDAPEVVRIEDRFLRVQILFNRAGAIYRAGEALRATEDDLDDLWSNELPPLLAFGHLAARRIAIPALHRLMAGYVGLNRATLALEVAEEALDRLPSEPEMYDIVTRVLLGMLFSSNVGIGERDAGLRLWSPSTCHFRVDEI